MSLTVEPGNGLYSGSPVPDNTDSSANLGRYRFTDERLSFSSAPGNSRGVGTSVAARVTCKLKREEKYFEWLLLSSRERL
ncbi:MAG: hypothetical protein V2I32_07215 [Desulforhopalus sp.]|nr:hypothetical protein [Desulforhopalus sp.]